MGFPPLGGPAARLALRPTWAAPATAGGGCRAASSLPTHHSCLFGWRQSRHHAHRKATALELPPPPPGCTHLACSHERGWARDGALEDKDACAHSS